MSSRLPKFLSQIACASAILGALLAPAAASPSVSTGTGPLAGMFYANFDNLPMGGAGGATNADINVSYTGDGQTVTGFLSGYYAAPYVNNNGGLFGDAEIGSDSTKYLSTGIGSVTLAFGAEQTYLGLLWGSVDLYNTLSLYDGSTLVGTITGGTVNAAANGDQGVNGSYYVNITSPTAFNRAVFTSSQYAFEFDNVAYNVDPPGAPVPEPLTLSLLGAGLMGLTVLRGRGKKLAAI